MAQPATRTLERLDVAGKRALVRVDFNVPLNADGSVGDDTRLRASLPTVQWLLDHGARSVVLMSHLGRPDGRPNPAYSLRPVAARFGDLLGRRVEFVADCVGDEVERAVRALEPGAVLLLENLRFHPEEEANDPGFARRLAAL